MVQDSEFDRLVEEYEQILKQDLSGISGDASVFAEYKVKLAHRLFRSIPGRLLEFGCGIGRNFPFLFDFFPGATICVSDNSKKSIEAVQRKFTGCRFFLSDTVQAFLRETEEYDACFVACVFHHIPRPEWTQWLAAIRQRLREGGEIIIFEHNLYNPLVRRIVTRSPIDANANFLGKKTLSRLLRETGYSIVATGYTLFFPRRSAWLEKIEWLLRWLPLGGQYYVVARRGIFNDRHIEAGGRA